MKSQSPTTRPSKQSSSSHALSDKPKRASSPDSVTPSDKPKFERSDEQREFISPKTPDDIFGELIEKKPNLFVSPVSIHLKKAGLLSPEEKNRWNKRVDDLKNMHAAANTEASDDIKKWIATPKDQQTQKIIAQPQLAYLTLLRTSAIQRNMTVAKIILGLDFSTKTNDYGKFLLKCLGTAIENIESLSPYSDISAFMQDNNIRKKTLEDLTLIKDNLQYMEDTSDVLERLHNSMRALAEAEGIVANFTATEDYGLRFAQISPIIKSTCANIVQTLNERGSVWIPMDIYFGPAGSQNEKLHFFIVSMLKTSSGRVQVSAYETNGGFDVSGYVHRSSSVEETSYVRHEIRLRDDLEMGEALDFTRKPGICNGYTIEQLLHPVNRLMNEFAILRPTFSAIIRSLQGISKQPITGSTLYNPDQPLRAAQKGDTCHFECINTAIGSHPRISPLSHMIIGLESADQCSYTVADHIAQALKDSSEGNSQDEIANFSAVVSKRIYDRKDSIKREITNILENTHRL